MSVGDAYSRTGAAWQRGPGVVYDRLAEHLVSAVPDRLAGALVLDLGAGTGAATRTLLARGAVPVAVDVAHGMLAAAVPRVRPVVGDALALPVRAVAFDGTVAAFSLNHLTDPVAGLREAARVTRPGGFVVGSAYAEDDAHEAKQAVEEAAANAGWSRPEWYASLQASAVPKLATAPRAAEAVAAAGLDVVQAEHRRIAFGDLGPRDLVEWRLGMAQLAPFVTTLPAAARESLVDHAVEALRGAPPLVRSIVVFVARVP